MEYHSTTKSNKLLIHTAWTNPNGIFLSEKSTKGHLCMYTYICMYIIFTTVIVYYFHKYSVIIKIERMQTKGCHGLGVAGTWLQIYHTVEFGGLMELLCIAIIVVITCQYVSGKTLYQKFLSETQHSQQCVKCNGECHNYKRGLERMDGDLRHFLRKATLCF